MARREETLDAYLEELNMSVPDDQVEDTKSVWKAVLDKIDRGEILEVIFGPAGEVEDRFNVITKEFIEDCHQEKSALRDYHEKKGNRRCAWLPNYAALSNDDQVFEVAVRDYFAQVEITAEETLVKPFRQRISAASYLTGYHLATE